MLIWILAGTNILFAAGLLYALWKIARYRELRKMRGMFGPWPIRQVEPGEVDARLATGPLGPARESEIRLITQYRVPGGISDLESWVLCNLARDARRVFEFGTATGKTAYLLALNSSPETEVVTLTLPPDQAGSYQAETGDDAGAKKAARDESIYAASFFYSGTPESAKIKQVFGDSKAFDDAPYAASCDLIFVDGSHARSYVESDTRKALSMVKPGGLVLWHDYRGPRAPVDVFRALNELSRELPAMMHIRNTALVAYRRPA